MKKKKIVFFTNEDEKIDGASLYEGEEIDYSDFPECITIPFLKDGEKVDVLYCIGEGELEKL